MPDFKSKYVKQWTCLCVNGCMKNKQADVKAETPLL
jgi:hypothetical protein